MRKLLAKPFFFLLVLSVATHSFALQIGEVASKKSSVGTFFVDDEATVGINNALTGTTKAIIAVAALVGFIFAFKGLHMIYEASQPQPKSTYAKGLITLMTGGALVSLPWVVFTSSNTVQDIQL